MNTHTGTSEELFSKAATKVAEAIKTTLEDKQQCTLGIVGGRSAPGMLEALAPHMKELPKGTIDVFWLDERIAADKNFTEAVPHLQKLKAPVQLHPFVSLDKQGMFDEIVVVEERLEELGMTFDVVILSAGEDGHICSLFPRHPVLTAKERQWTFVDNAPKPPPHRITVTIPLLLTAQYGVLFFIDKKDAYEKFSDEKTPLEECPAKFAKNIPNLDVFVG